ncbi:hypothetical protein FISHEDRAFT_59821 [Fistulina hepatica ATCC 64428]|uniref:Uncharacterized protein n=1 Tax=Fistulina hepatica ATCC 64428 TaxID=1128425 RepID=A0A0D7AB60_9AGAR|nr:hypothetical protein FISHEDRAFT_59821 [Fistulina hepatica ATCC 64428]
MSQLEDLTRCLVAVGGTMFPGADERELLYVNGRSLVSKLWTGQSFGTQQLVAASVRPSSSAVYIVKGKEKYIICISDSSVLRALVYDEDAEEWVDDGALGEHKVYPEGKVAGVVSENDKQYIFYQDAFGTIIHLDDDWTATPLPIISAQPGSPIAAAETSTGVHLFYVSATDSFIHHAIESHVAGSCNWTDSVFAGAAFSGGEKLKRIIASPSEGGEFVISAIAADNKLFQLTESGEKSVFGTLNDAGEVVPLTKEECCFPPRPCFNCCRRCGRPIGVFTCVCYSERYPRVCF